MPTVTAIAKPARPRSTPPLLSLLLASSALLAACGAPVEETEASSIQQQIQGGYIDNATSGVVGLGIFEKDHYFAGHCSGTLIAPNLVLTARHCVTQLPLKEDESQVECGVTEFRQTRAADTIFVSPETERPGDPRDPSFVRGLSVHPVPDAKDVCGFDVALLILERSLTEAEATPIVPRIDQETASQEDFSSTGYGLTADDENASSGMRMRLDGNQALCSTDECPRQYPEVVSEREWLSADAGVCSGDSGGPALDSEGRVIGVASRGGDGCRATIYGDVAAWADFIIEIALDAASIGAYEAPFWTTGSSEAAAAPPSSDEVVLDEPDLDEPDKAEPDEQSPHGDLECDPAECRDAPAFAAESGCTLARPSLGERTDTTGFGLALIFALVALRRRRDSSGRVPKRRPSF